MDFKCLKLFIVSLIGYCFFFKPKRGSETVSCFRKKNPFPGSFSGVLQLSFCFLVINFDTSCPIQFESDFLGLSQPEKKFITPKSIENNMGMTQLHFSSTLRVSRFFSAGGTVSRYSLHSSMLRIVILLSDTVTAHNFTNDSSYNTVVPYPLFWWYALTGELQQKSSKLLQFPEKVRVDQAELP